jgi:5-formyltetrahydrofolate cyclo-ligase
MTSEDKRALRRAVIAARADHVAAIDADARDAAYAALAAHVLPHITDAAIVASYAAYGAEIDPVAIEAGVIAAGGRIAFPRVFALGQPLTFHLCAYQDLQTGFRGLREPPANAPIVDPEVVLVPLTAADRAGNRIGQGAGLYDRTLALRRVQTIGLAWPVQIVSAIAADAWDVPLDAIATPDGWIDCAAAR